MRNIKATIEYNGSRFFGWQKQNGKRTVQGEIENAVFVLTGEQVAVEGSGRTDKGVHAIGQVASFKIENKMPLKNLKIALNNLLPDDVKIKKVENATDDFHARFSAKEKTYVYYVQIGQTKSAIKSDLLSFYTYDVDFEKIKSACKLVVGKHNFKAFCASDTTVTDFVREVKSFEVSKKGRVLKFEITGNGFLYNMVRIVVGTMLDLGRGKLTETDIKKALESGDRKFAGQTMPPNGLYLKEVRYI